MNRDNLLVLERLVVAVETISQDVKNIEVYIHDMNCSMSNFLKEKIEEPGLSHIPCVGENTPSLAPAADPETPAMGDCAWQHELADERSVVPIVDLEHEEEDGTYLIIGHKSTQNVLSAFPGVEEIEEPPKCEETVESHGVHNTFSEGDIDIGECATKRDIDESEVLLEPLFVPIKTEPCFEETSEEAVMGEDAAGSEIMEAIYSNLPPREQGDGWAAEHKENVVDLLDKVQCEEKKRPYIYCSSQSPCISHNASSSTQSLSELACDPASEEEAAALMKGHDEQMAGQRQKQQSEQSECSSYPNNEGTPFQSKMSSADKKSFKCSQCGYAFKRRDDLIKHMRCHTGDRPYKCTQCGKSFTQSSTLSDHMRSHTGERPYRCSQCGKSFSRSSTLNKHIYLHSGDRPYMCSQCGKSFPEKGTLNKHMHIHTGDRPYKCSQCGKSFTQSSSLSTHMHSHIGDRPYKCSRCGKSFTRSNILTDHMRLHTGDRPYKCTLCEESFTQSGHLTGHMRVHTGERPFKCSLCGKSFKVGNHLADHMRMHTGAQPYKCPQCGKTFTRSGSLSRHMKTHTGELHVTCTNLEESLSVP